MSGRQREKARVHLSAKHRQRQAQKYCGHFDAELPRGAQANRNYCDLRCSRAAHRARNREAAINAAKRAQRARNPQLHRASNLAWNKRNPEKIRAARQRFEARQRAAV